MPVPLAFEWDEGNINKNFLKHKVTNKEAEEAFENRYKLIIGDEKHSGVETRYLILGITSGKRKLSIIFTIRKNKVRVISARDMNKKERRLYEEKFKRHT